MIDIETGKQKYNHLKFLSVDEQIEIRNKIKSLSPKDVREEREKGILEYYFIKGYTAREIESLKIFKSRNHKYISSRRINQIVKEYFPDVMKKRDKDIADDKIFVEKKKHNKNIEHRDCYVYRYIDECFGDVKYIGISCSGSNGLLNRIKAHKRERGFSQTDYIDVIKVPNKGYAESLEGHFITLYQPRLNVAKAQWGIIKEFVKSNYGWMEIPKNIDDILKIDYCHYKKSKYRTEKSLAQFIINAENKRLAKNIEKLGLI